MKAAHILLLSMLFWICPRYLMAQINIPDVAPVVENFDGIGSSATTSLPANWKISPVGALNSTWNDAGNFTATTFAASSGTPVTGGRYNWAKTGDVDRSIGFITSSTYTSPNSIMAWYKNTNADYITSLTVSYDLFQFRINTATTSVNFYYSTDGSVWTPYIAGNAQTITTGASAYDFSSPANFGRSVDAGTSSFTITGLSIPANGNIYLRWEFKTSGSSSSQGLALDNVTVNAGFESANTHASIVDSNTIVESFDGMGASGIAHLPINWKMSPPATTSPDYWDPNNFTSTSFAASSGTPVTGGRYNWGKTGGIDRSIGFISSQSYLSQNSIMTWYTNGSEKNITSLTVSYDLLQFRIYSGVPTVTFYYSTDGSNWIPYVAGNAQTITISAASSYNFSSPANFGRSIAAEDAPFIITGLNIPPGGDIYLRWNFKTSGSSNSEGLALDNVQIKAGYGPKLTRGPYMNMATQTGITIRWRTHIPASSKVSFGITPDNLSGFVTDASLVTEHIAQLTGLIPNTKYYYSIGTTDEILEGDANTYFKTLPQTGSTQKIRILAMGDMGTNSNTQTDVRDAYLKYNGTNYTDAWLLLGDNSYENGLDSEYQTNFFEIYQDNLTKNHVLWPSPGNHDYANNFALAETHDVPYYDIFSLPKNGEAGGVPSGSEVYYSYNIGNIHFISLNSYASETSPTALFDTTSAEATWLKQDLAANKQRWTVVYFHHPPYSKGGSNSDTDPIDYRIRNKIVPILERYKVDLVLTGHSHDYERTFLINSHYGLSNTFDTATMALSSSSGRYDGSPNSSPYIKSSSDTRNGIIYALTGSAGQTGGTSSGYPHHAMEYSNVTTPGCMVIEVEDNRLDAKWICSDGIIRDNFTVFKDVNRTTDTTISYGSGITLTASWVGNYVWSNGATTRSITVNPTSGTAYTVTDSLNYLKDSFSIKVTSKLIASARASVVMCKGGTASVNVTVTGGKAPYTGIGDFTVTAGTYTYTVQDANGDTSNATITIDEPSVLVVSSDGGNILCNGGTANIHVNAEGGTAPYNGIGNFTVGAGTYNYTVTDANGCTGNTSITMTEPDQLIANANAGTIGCYGGVTTVAIDATGGTGPYTGTGNFTVGAGTYNYTVTDANGCAGTASISVNQPDELKTNVNTGTINCFGGSTTIVVDAAGGTAPYNGVGNFSVSSGTYNYNITDANGCTATASITVAEPAELKANANEGTINCYGSSATVTVNATGGAAPYTGIGNFTLEAGTYTYDITDANGCHASTSVTLTQPDASLHASAVAGIINCNGGTTTVTVDATGGAAPYTGTGNFTAGAGSHDYAVTDANGCTSVATVTVNEPSPFTANAAATSINCNSGTAIVSVNAAGGTAPYSGTGDFSVGTGTYSYIVTDANGCSASTSVTVSPASSVLNANATAGTINCNGGTTTVTVDATGGAAPYTGTGNFTVGAGTYNYTVTDANGCSASTSVTVAQPDILNASATPGIIKCYGDNTSITVIASGGTAPYLGTGNFTIGAGTYNYLVTDANGCTASVVTAITQPSSPLSVSAVAGTINCYGGTTTVTVSAIGGTAPYAGTGNFTVGAGTYNYTVTDANGCASTVSITVNQPAATLVASATAGTIICNGSITNVSVNASGGTAPYSGTGNFSIGAGSYNYTVTDAKGCSAIAAITVSQPTAVVVSATASPIKCAGVTTTVSVSATGGTSPYTGIGNFTVSAGAYNYTVKDSKGCTGSTSIMVTQPAPIGIAVSGNTIACYGGTSTVTITATGGSGIYQYSLNGFTYQSNNTFTNLSVRTYTVWVKDANGCISTKTFTVTQPASPVSISLLSKNNVSCKNGSDGSITMRAAGGTSPYTYRLNNGIFTTSSTFNALKAGTYTITAKDANSCTASISESIANGVKKCNTASSTINFVDSQLSLQIKVSPNPTMNEFTLSMESNDKQNVQIIVTDIYGKKIFQTNGSVNETYKFGNNFASGMYIVQVMQGKNIQTLKLIKGK